MKDIVSKRCCNIFQTMKIEVNRVNPSSEEERSKRLELIKVCYDKGWRLPPTVRDTTYTSVIKSLSALHILFEVCNYLCHLHLG